MNKDRDMRDWRGQLKRNGKWIFLGFMVLLFFTVLANAEDKFSGPIGPFCGSHPGQTTQQTEQMVLNKNAAGIKSGQIKVMDREVLQNGTVLYKVELRKDGKTVRRIRSWINGPRICTVFYNLIVPKGQGA